MKALKLVVIVAISCLLMACDHDFENPSEQDFLIFSKIRLIRTGLEYPYTLEHLAQCKAIGDKRCLQVFNIVRTAKQTLFAIDREQALQLTLNTILKRCGDGTIGEDSVCGGAATALYFFSTPDEDRIIQNFFTGAPLPILDRVVGLDNAWLLNRADKQMWRNWVNTLEINADLRHVILFTLDTEKPSGLSIDVL